VARGVGKAFAGVSVLRNVDLTLRGGEVHGIVGENGAGKSTLAKMIGGVFPPSEGEIEFGGKLVEFSSPRQALESGIALIHQEPLVFPNLSVAENVFVGNQPRRQGSGAVDWKEMVRKASSLFSSLGVSLDPMRSAGGLSVADQQMIELASALNHQAKVILFDETTASLTPYEVAELFAVMRRLKAEGTAIAIVTHRLDEIFEITDRISVLRDGDKVFETTTAETTPAEVIRHMVGRELELSGQQNTVEFTADPLLETKGLSSGKAFRNVSLKVRPGEIVCLAGLVGAGRTEVCEAVFGARKVSAGSIRFAGRDVSIRSPGEAIQLGMAMAPEDRQHNGLVLPFGIGVNIGLPSIKKLSLHNWLNFRHESSVAELKATDFGVKYSRIQQPVRELSGGNQQKVVLAKWLLTEPNLLILDEPTRGVDLRTKQNIHTNILGLARSKGLAILMVSSDLGEVLQLADRILVMRAGTVAAEFTRESATPEKVMAAATQQPSLEALPVAP
jgi:rhamnose transport system ATP-binding protein